MDIVQWICFLIMAGSNCFCINTNDDIILKKVKMLIHLSPFSNFDTNVHICFWLNFYFWIYMLMSLLNSNFWKRKKYIFVKFKQWSNYKNKLTFSPLFLCIPIITTYFSIEFGEKKSSTFLKKDLDCLVDSQQHMIWM